MGIGHLENELSVPAQLKFIYLVFLNSKMLCSEIEIVFTVDQGLFIINNR